MTDTTPSSSDGPTGDANVQPGTTEGRDFAPGDFVTDLREGDSGTWHIRTRSALHILNIDNMTYRRVPGEDSNDFETDGEVVGVNRISMPTVGKRIFLYFDDPFNPDGPERWHATSNVRSIQRAEDAPK